MSNRQGYIPLEVVDLKEAFLNRNLEEEVAPDLEELAGEFDVEYRLVRSIAKQENWVGMRNHRRNLLRRKISEEEDKALSQRAVDIVTVQTRFLNDSLKIINVQLPDALAEIERRLPELGDKELVMYFKALLDHKIVIQKLLILAAKGSDEDLKKTANDAKAEYNSIVDKARIINEVRKNTKTDKSSETDEEAMERERILAELDDGEW